MELTYGSREPDVGKLGISSRTDCMILYFTGRMRQSTELNAQGIDMDVQMHRS